MLGTRFSAFDPQRTSASQTCQSCSPSKVNPRRTPHFISEVEPVTIRLRHRLCRRQSNADREHRKRPRAGDDERGTPPKAVGDKLRHQERETDTTEKLAVYSVTARDVSPAGSRSK